MNSLWSLSFPAWQFIVRGTVVYLAILLLLRLGGKRQVAQMGPGEFVAILLISNAVQNAMNGGDNSITGGLILSVVLVLLSVLVAYLTYRSKTLERLIEGTPRLLVHDGKPIEAHLKAELLNRQELLSIMRKQGVHSFSDVAEAVLEANGTLTITKKSEQPPLPH